MKLPWARRPSFVARVTWPICDSSVRSKEMRPFAMRFFKNTSSAILLRMKNLPALMLLVTALSACNSDVDTQRLEQLSKDLKDTLSSTKDKVVELSPSTGDIKNLTTDEFKKLATFEYKVTEVPRVASALELEAQLALLGADRWECFQIDPAETHYRIFCRRRPETYLRYLPRMFP
jgi:hypothetical protein